MASLAISLNGMLEALRIQKSIEWIGVRHEETAAFAAGAQAHLTGELAVCAGSCGPGNMHLINGLYDCHRSRVPVLAIAAQIPSNEIGSNYFQETHPDQLFRNCSHYCELVSQPSQMPRVLELAIQSALSKKGVAVMAIPGDIALQKTTYRKPSASIRQVYPVLRPSEAEVKTTGRSPERIEDGHDPRRGRMCRGPRGTHASGGQAAISHRHGDARPRTHSV